MFSLAVLLALVASVLTLPFNGNVIDPKVQARIAAGKGNPDEWGPYFQGDIYMPPPHNKIPQNGIIDEQYRWVGGKVPYEYKADFNTSYIATVQRAMEEYRTVTRGCIDFVARTDELDRVRFGSDDNGCYSSVGKRGGRQTINYPEWCINRYGSVLHEMLHALGFYHEQSRFDRDDYVKINYTNIEEGYESNFNKYSDTYISGFGEQYDYLSVMHYSAYGFAIDYDYPTIITLDPAYQQLIGQRENLTITDWNKLLTMYNCGFTITE